MNRSPPRIDGAARRCYNKCMVDSNDILKLSAAFGIRAEYKTEMFPSFLSDVRSKKVCLVCDRNTEAFAVPVCDWLKGSGVACTLFRYDEYEPVADEAHCAAAAKALAGCDYALAVGAGTLNDICKYVTFLQGKECGVLATAASMDGYSSGVTPLIKNGFKITENAHTVKHVLLDFGILCSAPKIMTGAGAGDILAKYCCLTDWKISHLLTGEPLNEEAAGLMRVALQKCVDEIDGIRACGKEGVDSLMRALLISGYAMVIAGNSRPASGAEHHMSHFLEMDFLRRGKPIPLHGVKVGLGTMVSLRMYHRLAETDRGFPGKEEVLREAEKLPPPEFVRDVLASLQCPTRFSQIGVSEDTVRDMLFNCYKIRDRFTIMTLYNRYDLMREAADALIAEFY